jgi:hypothetical protein
MTDTTKYINMYTLANVGKRADKSKLYAQCLMMAVRVKYVVNF